MHKTFALDAGAHKEFEPKDLYFRENISRDACIIHHGYKT